jgi:hypothetical protein
MSLGLAFIKHISYSDVFKKKKIQLRLMSFHVGQWDDHQRRENKSKGIKYTLKIAFVGRHLSQ